MSETALALIAFFIASLSFGFAVMGFILIRRDIHERKEWLLSIYRDEDPRP